MNMQKSVLTHSQPRRPDGPPPVPAQDKGAKYEPFWSAAFGTDRHSLARLRLADQKR